MTRFNLTFSGEIIAGHDPAQVKLRFANLFDIDDPVRLERFFSGDTIILRRNLERKAAAQCYHELHQMGALAALVKIVDSEADTAATPGKQPSPATATGNPRRRTTAREPDRPARSAGKEQTWAVSTAASKGKLNGKSSRTSTASRTNSTSSAWQRDNVDIAAGLKARKLETLRQAAQLQASEQAAQAERERLAAEAAARKQAEALERERLAEEEVARQQAERESIAAAEAARQQEIAAEAARKAAEDAARLAEEQARVRAREAEEEALRKAAEEEARRKAAEEAERREAERKRQKEEQAQRKAQAAAARKAEQDEKRRRDAEEKARRKAALEERKRQQAIEAARRKAELEEQRRQAAAEAARRKAALEEQKRQAAAEAARRKAELEEQQRLEAAARRKAAQEEQQRRAAEEEARRIAAREAQARQEEEEAARQKAELEELKRREAEEEARLQAELAAIKLREAEEAQRLQVELEEQARQAAAQAARIKAEAQRQQLEAQQKSAERRRAIAEALAARQARQAEKRRQAEEAPARQDAKQPQIAHDVVQELLPPSPARRARPRIRTALEVPPRKSQQDAKAPEPRKRQPGEPNVYKLRPFRNTEEVRTRALLARQRARHGYTLGILGFAALLILAGSFLQRTAAPATPGARAIAVDPRSGPLLLAQDALLLHDRAGIGTGVKPLRALGLAALDPPLAFDDSGTLMAMGVTSIDEDSSPGSARQLLRCAAPLEQCAPFSSQLADNTIDAFVVNPVDGSVLLADRSIGLLLKSDRDGAIVARADAVFAQHLVMRLHTGLLLMNSATAPAISVLRYENNAFGQQLDEILLLPPGVEDLDKLRVGDFLWSAGAWWVSLQHPESGNAGLYRFDEEWNFIDEVSLPATAGTLQLANWGDKVLANDPQHLAIQRISATGAVEAAFVSPQLEKVSAEQARRAWLVNLGWRGALLLCALAAALGTGLGYLQSRRALVYQAHREQGAEPLDEHVSALQWIDPAANRQALLRRRMAGYSTLALGAVLLAVAGNVSAWQLGALMLALSGPAVALLLQGRRSTGHIGVLGDRLVLVDHSGTYHLAGGSRIQHRGPFLSIDDVVVYCGDRLLPAFSAPQIKQLVSPLVRGGVKVDRDTIAVKLLQSRHPIALGVLAIAAALAAAIALLCLQEMA